MAQHRLLQCSLIGLVCGSMLATEVADAYPSAVVFIPSGYVLPLGRFKATSYIPLNFHPDVIPGTSSVGLGAGVAPSFSCGSSSFYGGFETGFDLVNGAFHRSGARYVKAVFNAKAGVLRESEFLPASSVGLMSFSPLQRTESLNHLYVSFSKALSIRGTSLGTFTLGGGYVIAAKQYTYSGSEALGDTHFTLFAGYGTDEWHHFSLYVDSVVGTSDMSSTNLGLGYSAAKGTFLMLGAYVANNRALPKSQIYDGGFVSFTVKWELFAIDT